LCLPLLAALRREQPSASLHFAGVHEHACVLAAYGAVDVALSSEDLHLWALAGSGAAAARARERLSRYSRVVGDAEELNRLDSADTEVRVFAPLPPVTGVHAADWLLLQLGLPVAQAGDSLFRSARGAAPRAILLHPGAGGEHKRWPRARFLELAGELARTGHEVAVAFGPVELERDDPRAWPWPRGTAFAASGDAVTLAQQLAASRACIANDSGPAHLAAALGVPTVAVFGPTDPTVWAPRGGHVRVVGGPTSGPPDAPVGAVLAAVADLGLGGVSARSP
jgi:heptosyltransferase-3